MTPISVLLVQNDAHHTNTTIIHVVHIAPVSVPNQISILSAYGVRLREMILLSRGFPNEQTSRRRRRKKKTLLVGCSGGYYCILLICNFVSTLTLGSGVFDSVVLAAW